MTTGLYAQGHYTIYPIPQQQKVLSKKGAKLTKKIIIVADEEIDKVTLERAEAILTKAGFKSMRATKPHRQLSNLFLAVVGSGGKAEAYCRKLDKSVLSTKGKFDRHILSIKRAGAVANIRILGEHCTATFYGLASLEQILEQSKSSVREVLIEDYADQQSRGIVEGYYGYPYSIAVKKDLMNFMMRFKMNTYMYGAKSDPYHSEKWEEAYPSKLTEQDIKNGLISEDMLRDLSETSHQTKVNFIWAIHPGNDFVASDDVNRRIMNKFTKMYALGIRQFAVFVDDVGVPQTEQECQTNADRLTKLQEAIDTKWNVGATKEADKVKPLHFVPQVYTLSWVKAEDRKRFYKSLSSIPEKITVYFTGRGVWTVPNQEDLDIINTDFGRKLAWWWNYPCNDNADSQIFPSDMYHNFEEMPAVDGKSRLPKSLDNGLGIVSNPMQQGEVSKTALFSVADYAWNNSAFDNDKSWEKSFDYIIADKAKREAYKMIAPYLRANEPKEMGEAIAKLNGDEFNSDLEPLLVLLRKLLPQIEVLRSMEESEVEAERLLYQDIKPFVNKLATMLPILQYGTDGEWAEYPWDLYLDYLRNIEELNNSEDYRVYALEGLGSGISVSHQQAKVSAKYLTPFILGMKSKLLNNIDYFQGYKVLLTKSLDLSKPIKINAEGEVFIESCQEKLGCGAYFGLEFLSEVKPLAIKVNEDWLAKNPIYYSTNGTDCIRLTKNNYKQVKSLKYIYLIHTEEDTFKTYSWTKDDLKVILPMPAKLKRVILPNDRVGAMSDKDLKEQCIIDGKVNTYYACGQNQKNGDTYTVELAEATDVRDVRIYFGLVNNDYIDEGIVEASKDGETWYTLRIKGTELTDGGIARATKLNKEVAFLDFEGFVRGVKYVRLILTKAKTNKWLRLYEISVNHLALERAMVVSAVDERGRAVAEVVDSNFDTFISEDNFKGNKLRYHIKEFRGDEDMGIDFNVYWHKTDEWEGKEPTIYFAESVDDKGRKFQLTNLGKMLENNTRVILPSSKAKQQDVLIVWDNKENGKSLVPKIYELKSYGIRAVAYCSH